MNDDQLNSSRENNFTKNLQYLLQKNKFTSVELAHAIGVSAELIGKLKNGHLKNPSLKVLIGIGGYFKISLQDLVFADLEHQVVGNLSDSSVAMIPVVEWDNVSDVNLQSIKSSKYICVDSVVAHNAFSVFIQNKYGPFKKNSYLVINKDIAWKDLDFVLVGNKVDGGIQLKRVILDDVCYLQNVALDANASIPYNSDKHIIYGVIVGYQKNKIFSNYCHRDEKS